MNEEVVEVFLLVDFLFQGGELEPSHGEVGNLPFGPSEKIPAAWLSEKPPRVGLQHSWSVVLRMGGERDKFHWLICGDGGLQLRQAPGHFRTRAGAEGENDVGDP